jgi:hypothetical protein
MTKHSWKAAGGSVPELIGSTAEREGGLAFAQMVEALRSPGVHAH